LFIGFIVSGWTNYKLFKGENEYLITYQYPTMTGMVYGNFLIVVQGTLDKANEFDKTRDLIRKESNLLPDTKIIITNIIKFPII
jgi:hypothetical protein